MQTVWQLLTLIAALLAGALVAHAHQPYESSAVARLGHEGLELTVTTSTEIAGRFIGEPLSDGAALESRRPRLLEICAELYEVTANGIRLQPERVFFSLKGGEAVFSLIYPGATADGFRFRAAYLDRLPPGYGGSIEVFDEAGRLLGRQPLLKKGEMKDAFSVRLSAADSNPVSAPVPAEAREPSWIRTEAGQAGIASSGNDDAWLQNIVSFGAVLLLGVGVGWQIRRSRV